eukprot:TRINITY_DN10700_c0_g1_i1.p1 TRINITY_DN10700_c0_g1~~TRINITY_DN10700_c0_g1_i1.p1  ORF type:complete len:195 (+),score=11.40 TRINITY_DN10700_c0_g1_i1:24-587(+)
MCIRDRKETVVPKIKESILPKVKEADNNEGLIKNTQDILEKAHKAEKKEIQYTLYQLQMKIVYKRNEGHFKDEIVKKIWQLQDDYKQAKQIKQVKKANVQRVKDHQRKLQKEINEVRKNLKCKFGRSAKFSFYLPVSQRIGLFTINRLQWCDNCKLMDWLPKEKLTSRRGVIFLQVKTKLDVSTQLQ